MEAPQRVQLGQGLALGVQTVAQLPLLRHSWPLGQAQATGSWQVLPVTCPHRPAQVTSGGSGVQHVPLRHN